MFVYSDGYRLDWGGHIFPVEKYRLTYERLVELGLAGPHNTVAPRPATREELERVHDPGYLDELQRLAREGLDGSSVFEAPLTEKVLAAATLGTGGSVLAARTAREHGACFNLTGGFHHARADAGGGFCFVNDVAVAIRAAQAEGLARKVLVVDCDLHQGDGTASVFLGDDSVFILDVHQENIYPPKVECEEMVGLPPFTGDEVYLSRLEDALGRAFRNSFGLMVYLAGADPFQKDQLGDLMLTLDGFARRDDLVLGRAQGAGLPVAVLMAGGYPPDVEDAVAIHVQTARRMLEIAR